jgi:hypothetical protein
VPPGGVDRGVGVGVGLWATIALTSQAPSPKAVVRNAVSRRGRGCMSFFSGPGAPRALKQRKDGATAILSTTCDKRCACIVKPTRGRIGDT